VIEGTLKEDLGSCGSREVPAKGSSVSMFVTLCNSISMHSLFLVESS
jgi:hypothetical protein